MKIRNVQIYGLENAIRCSKFPMSIDTENLDSTMTNRVISLGNARQGSGHDTYLKGVIVQFDLTFSNKAWVEAERYHWFDFISSQSTMHKITKMNIKEQCNKYVDDRIIQIVQDKVDEYNSIEPKDRESEYSKNLYLNVLYNIPSGFELTAGITTNYLQLKTIYNQRKYHRLPEWREVCKWVESLEMFRELCLANN